LIADGITTPEDAANELIKKEKQLSDRGNLSETLFLWSLQSELLKASKKPEESDSKQAKQSSESTVNQEVVDAEEAEIISAELTQAEERQVEETVCLNSIRALQTSARDIFPNCKRITFYPALDREVDLYRTVRNTGSTQESSLMLHEFKGTGNRKRMVSEFFTESRASDTATSTRATVRFTEPEAVVLQTVEANGSWELGRVNIPLEGLISASDSVGSLQEETSEAEASLKQTAEEILSYALEITGRKPKYNTQKKANADQVERLKRKRQEWKDIQNVNARAISRNEIEAGNSQIDRVIPPAIRVKVDQESHTVHLTVHASTTQPEHAVTFRYKEEQKNRSITNWFPGKEIILEDVSSEHLDQSELEKAKDLLQTTAELFA
jgi:hypothetical protein